MKDPYLHDFTSVDTFLQDVLSLDIELIFGHRIGHLDGFFQQVWAAAHEVILQEAVEQTHVGHVEFVAALALISNLTAG